MAEKKRVFEKNIKPHLGEKPFARVTRDQLGDVVALKFEAGRGTASNRVHSELSVFWNWAVKRGSRLLGLKGDAVTGMIPNPMSQVCKLAGETVRERALSEREVGWFLRALPAAAPQKRKSDPRYKGDEFPAIYELLLRTGTRLSDIFELEAGEVQGDDLVLGDTKNRLAHVVWLHPSAKRLLEGRLEGKTDRERVFSVWKDTDAINGLRAEVERLAALEGETVEHWTTHDLRRTATSIIASFRDPDTHASYFTQELLDRLLAHKEQGVIRHYNKWKYYPEKRQALKLWNDWLDRQMGR